MSRYFGTDGVRGRAGEGKLSDDRLRDLGAALAAFVGAGGSVAIGRDTRLSGPNMAGILRTSLTGGGVNVHDLGIVPTPATALLTQTLGADLGIMITASHNPWHDNGVKLFGPDGRKLADVAQAAIESSLGRSSEVGSATGAVTEETHAPDDYVRHVVRAVGGSPLNGLSVVADAANGAAYHVLPEVLRQLGATVHAIGTSTDGRVINDGVGSNNPDAVAAAIGEHGADVGVAVDGDADRIVMVDRHGQLADGDQIMARLASDMAEDGTIEGGAVVATVMSNLGLERHVEALGLRFERTAVGDRHVAKRMGEIGANLGGEASGHILLTDHAMTGDGTLSAALLLAGLAKSGLPSDKYLRAFEPVPQRLVNVRYDGSSPLERSDVQDAIASEHAAIAGQGRILVRASGTEPLIRVMVEGDDASVVSQVADKLSGIIAAAAKN